MLETVGIDVDVELVACWRKRVAAAREHLGWPGDAASMVDRPHRGGTSLALAAPVDQLFTATEVNEWAVCATLLDRDLDRWQGLEAALVAAALEQAADPATVIPPVLEDDAALLRFTRLARDEARPDVTALLQAAHARNVLTVLDEDALTLGAGAHGRTWPLTGLPVSGDVPWPALRGIPIAAVTGSNGKTTTVRLIAACLRAHGLRDGHCCTDGVFVGHDRVDAGDYSGPAGTRRVLRDERVEAAVLEMARGGILRRGLPIDRADVAVVTNISADHFGEYGIDDLDGLADTKLTVARLVATGGWLVLNADDDLLWRKSASLPERPGPGPQLAWFAMDYELPRLRERRDSGAPVCGVRNGELLLSFAGAEHSLGRVAEVPITVGGTAGYNVANLAGAALAAVALDVPAATVREVYERFGRDPADNAGRLMRFDRRGATFIVDYAHNPDGLRGVLHVARQLRREGGRLVTLLGHAGNRRDEDIADLARTAASFEPDLVVVKEDEGHLRGRQPGEVPAILRQALLGSGLRESSVVMCDSELAAARHAIETARSGDAVALLVHSASARAAVLELLRGLD